eukprot:480680-Amphidinium_carterae.1
MTINAFSDYYNYFNIDIATMIISTLLISLTTIMIAVGTSMKFCPQRKVQTQDASTQTDRSEATYIAG